MLPSSLQLRGILGLNTERFEGSRPRGEALMKTKKPRKAKRARDPYARSIDPPQRADPARSGAFMVLLAAVAGPASSLLVSYGVAFAGAGLALSVWAWDLVSAPIVVVLALGAYRLTAGGREDGISDELRALTRLVGVVAVIAALLVIVTLVRADWIGHQFFKRSVDYTLRVANALLLLVAARHLLRTGWSRAATTARVLSALTLAFMPAEHFMTRIGRDELYRPLPAPYPELVFPIRVALWLGAILVFVLTARASGAGSPAMRRARRVLRPTGAGVRIRPSTTL